MAKKRKKRKIKKAVRKLRPVKRRKRAKRKKTIGKRPRKYYVSVKRNPNIAGKKKRKTKKRKAKRIGFANTGGAFMQAHRAIN